MQTPEFIAHKTYLKDLETKANSTRPLSYKFGKNSPLLNNKPAVVLTVFLMCATVLPFAI